MKFTSSDQKNSGERKYKFRQAVRSDVGRRRSENQDSYAIVHTATASLYIVADGMGGSRGGRTASTIAVNLIAREAFNEDQSITELSLRRAIEAANEEIFLRSRNDEKLAGMGTTVVAFAFVNNQVIVAHIGDSRAYRLHENAFAQVTRDHSLIRELIDSGAMNELNVDNHPIAHMLTRSLGPAREVEVEIQTLNPPMEAGDKFLLCCDGLHNLVRDEEIAEALIRRATADACDYLLELALERGGTDNITITIAEACPLDEAADVELPAGDEVQRLTSADFDFSINPPPRTPEPIAPEQHAQTAQMARASQSFRPGVMGVLLSLLFIAIFMWYLEQGKNGSGDEVATTQTDEPAGTSREGTPELTNELLAWKPEKPVTATVPVAKLVPELAEGSASSGTIDARALAPTPETGQIQKNEAVEEVIRRALDLSVDDRPSVVLELAKNPQDKPLIWEHERIPQIDGEEAIPLFAPSEGNANDESNAVEVYSDEEKRQLVRDKQSAREETADIDTKLELLLLEDENQRQNKIAELEVRSSLLVQAHTELEAERAAVSRDFDTWHDFEVKLNEDSAPEVLRALAAVDDDAKKKQELFDAVSSAYLKAVEAWQNNQEDDKHVAKMAAVGRDFRAARAELPDFVRDRLAARLGKIAHDYSELDLKLAMLDVRQQRLQREIGFTKSVRITNFGQKKAKYERLVKSREKSVQRLRTIQDKLSDREELNFRRREIIAELRSRPVPPAEIANGNLQ